MRLLVSLGDRLSQNALADDGRSSILPSLLLGVATGLLWRPARNRSLSSPDQRRYPGCKRRHSLALAARRRQSIHCHEEHARRRRMAAPRRVLRKRLWEPPRRLGHDLVDGSLLELLQDQVAREILPPNVSRASSANRRTPPCCCWDSLVANTISACAHRGYVSRRRVIRNTNHIAARPRRPALCRPAA